MRERTRLTKALTERLTVSKNFDTNIRNAYYKDTTTLRCRIFREVIDNMIRQWEVFTHRSSSRSDAPRVSLNLGGRFSINQRAFEILGEPQAIELLFDKLNSLIGMRPCSPDLKHAYAVRKQGKSASYVVAGQAFCNYYNIRLKSPVVFQDIELDGNVVVLDLRKVKEMATRQSKSKQPENLTQQNSSPQLVAVS